VALPAATPMVQAGSRVAIASITAARSVWRLFMKSFYATSFPVHASSASIRIT
jgi:hypothetical protein